MSCTMRFQKIYEEALGRIAKKCDFWQTCNLYSQTSYVCNHGKETSYCGKYRALKGEKQHAQ